MDNDSSSGAFVAGLFGVMGLFYLALIAFFIWMQWRILVKAGYSGWLSLLLLTGIGGLIIQIILAFGRWPIEDRLAAAGVAPAPVPPYAAPPAVQ